jgi:SAM-dependent methyltransferase
LEPYADMIPGGIAGSDSERARPLPPYTHLLSCPLCGFHPGDYRGGASCDRCDFVFPPIVPGRQPDFRIRKSVSKTMTYDPTSLSGSTPALRAEISRQPVSFRMDKARDLLSGDLVHGNRLSEALLSHLPQNAAGMTGFMLDLGCGPRQVEEACRAATGLGYVGIDYSGTEPDLLADAHALPFVDHAFELIVSFAVLEHLACPDMAAREALRVLKPGGKFVGTVAFLEPFHMNSYFHMTHLGVARVLESAGFELLELAPNRDWHVLQAQGEMALFPGAARYVRDIFLGPALMASRMVAALRRKHRPRTAEAEVIDLAGTTGGFRFVARKPILPERTAPTRS